MGRPMTPSPMNPMSCGMAFGGSYVEGWKYVNLRRHFIYEKRSIDGGAQWAVFEPKSAMPPGRASILARE